MPEDKHDFSARQSAAVPADRARQRELDWEDTRRPWWVGVIALLCVIVLLAGLVVLSQSSRTSAPTLTNGDQLGPFEENYPAVADAAFAAMEGDEPRWALVTPAEPQTADELTRMFTGLGSDQLRVSTLLLGPISMPIAEPAAGMTRLDVFNAVANQLAGALGGRPTDVRFEGVLVRATPDVLREIKSRPGVQLVEPAAVGAAYGRIGLRPVSEQLVTP